MQIIMMNFMIFFFLVMNNKVFGIDYSVEKCQKLINAFRDYNLPEIKKNFPFPFNDGMPDGFQISKPDKQFDLFLRMYDNRKPNKSPREMLSRTMRTMFNMAEYLKLHDAECRITDPKRLLIELKKNRGLLIDLFLDNEEVRWQDYDFNGVFGNWNSWRTSYLQYPDLGIDDYIPIVQGKNGPDILIPQETWLGGEVLFWSENGPLYPRPKNVPVKETKGYVYYRGSKIYEVDGKRGYWVRIVSNVKPGYKDMGDDGWVFSPYMKFFIYRKFKELPVLDDGLQFFEDMGKKQIGSLNKGVNLKVLEVPGEWFSFQNKEGHWIKVQISDSDAKKTGGKNIGWVFSHFVDADALKQEYYDSHEFQVTSKDGLNVRYQPDTKGKAIFTLANGAKVKVLFESPKVETLYGKTANWLKIRAANGDEGFVFGGFIEKL